MTHPAVSVPAVTHTLSNGLDVIVHESRHAPLVAVSVWYHVGSKNERVGQTGLAHLFEHVMFEGAAHQPRGYFEPLQQAGAELNGSTSADRTNYWEVVPKDAAKLALWMEADRMGWLLPALSEERFATQRDVVLNERRQNYENRPYGLASFATMAAVYPLPHPYHWPTIGEPDDLHAATVDDARTFFGRYYHPGNASLAIAGDIDADQALSLAESLFDQIPAAAHVEPVMAAPPTARHVRLVMEDRVELPRLYMAWPTPPLFAPGDAELDLVADLLGNGRTSRLYARLVHERRIATELAAGQGSRELSGTFQVLATAAPGHTLAELRQAIVEAIEEFQQDGPDVPELERGRAQAEAAFVFRTQSLGGFGGKADQLNAYNVHCGSPDSFAWDLARYTTASAESLTVAARQWLNTGQAVELSVVPHGQASAALPDSVEVGKDLA